MATANGGDSLFYAEKSVKDTAMGLKVFGYQLALLTRSSHFTLFLIL
jgi:hypothetical protein